MISRPATRSCGEFAAANCPGRNPPRRSTRTKSATPSRSPASKAAGRAARKPQGPRIFHGQEKSCEHRWPARPSWHAGGAQHIEDDTMNGRQVSPRQPGKKIRRRERALPNFFPWLAALVFQRQTAQPKSVNGVFPLQLRQKRKPGLPRAPQDQAVLRAHFFDPWPVRVGIAAVGQIFWICGEVVRRHEGRFETGHVTPGGAGVCGKSVVEKFMSVS